MNCQIDIPKSRKHVVSPCIMLDEEEPLTLLAPLLLIRKPRFLHVLSNG